jgi:membrane associated rhomboid family serine protease
MLVKKLRFLVWLCALLIGVHIVNILVHYQLNRYGIYPRHWQSLWTIFAAPFLHGSIYHLVNNLIGLCLFSGFYLIHSLRRYVYSSLVIIVVTGLLVWLFGRNAIHVGASGWVFGLWGLCIATAWFERRPMNILIACVVVIFYGGVIYGVLPRDAGVSFESHFFGVFAGIFSAYLNAKHNIK